MKAFFKVGGYSQWIEITKGGVIDYSCECRDFVYRRLKKVGRKTVVMGVCKHINKIRKIMDKKIKWTKEI